MSYFYAILTDRLQDCIKQSLYTAFLFTKSDIKTTLIPVVSIRSPLSIINYVLW